jgi:hypothetical protein
MGETNTSNDEKQKKRILDKIIKYIKYDDLIKDSMQEHKEKLKELKIQKEENEKEILKYLEKHDSDTINISETDKLNRFTSVRTVPLNQEIIKTSIFEKMCEDKIFPDEDLCIQYVDSLYEYMKTKREKKTKISLKRTKKRAKKPKTKKIEK